MTRKRQQHEQQQPRFANEMSTTVHEDVGSKPSGTLFRTLIRHMPRRQNGYNFGVALVDYYYQHRDDAITQEERMNRSNFGSSLGQLLFSLLFPPDMHHHRRHDDDDDTSSGCSTNSNNNISNGSIAAIFYRSILLYVISQPTTTTIIIILLYTSYTNDLLRQKRPTRRGLILGNFQRTRLYNNQNVIRIYPF
jgi:hypothetical protein